MTDMPRRCAWCGGVYGAFLALLSHIDDEHLVTPINVVSLAEARRARREQRITSLHILPTPA